MDCGSGVLSSLQNYISIDELDAVILTHFHHDHVADIGPLQYSKLIQSQLNNDVKTLPIYAPNHEKDFFQKLTFNKHTKGKVLEENKEYAIGPFVIHTIKTTHPAYCLAIKLTVEGQSVVFTADTEWFVELGSFSSMVDLLISESNLYKSFEGQIPGHMSGRQAGLLAKEAKVKKLILTHLPHFGELNQLVAEAKQNYKGEVEIAKVGGKSYFLSN